ncbi:hypothetical protein [Geothrix sp. PMB-07]|uniref:hypothetical protein n=1 Tax=Geothrix sp. PMB-07 TaxID=3068640 RepID=UPI002740E822|nr:hypothetical protein [Geothrix sp. PMB-07]WLT30736.1 hypothetical protein Q9293_13525 [Geothrix sp. PMB-07]
MPLPSPGAPRPGRAMARRLTWGVAIFNLLIVALGAGTLIWSRSQYLDRAETATHNLAQVLEQNMLGMVNQIDLVQLAVKDHVEGRQPTLPDQEVQALLQTQVSRARILHALRVADATGLIKQGTQIPEHQSLTVDDRDYFQHLKAHPDTGLFISRPIQGRISGMWVVIFARRLNQRNGQFAGVVYGTITIDRLVSSLSELDVGPHGSVSLRGSNLELLARFPKLPNAERYIGDAKVEGEYLRAVQSGRHISHFTVPSVIDGQPRTYTLRRLSNPTFFILVGLAQEDYLQAWRREAYLSGTAVLGILILSFVIARMARSAWNRQLASQAERDQLIEDLTLALAEVKHLKGMLPICGQCKKIRDSQGRWIDLESYISDHSDATFSHGVCPDCVKDLREEMRARRVERDQDPDPG